MLSRGFHQETNGVEHNHHLKVYLIRIIRVEKLEKTLQIQQLTNMRPRCPSSGCRNPTPGLSCYNSLCSYLHNASLLEMHPGDKTLLENLAYPCNGRYYVALQSTPSIFISAGEKNALTPVAHLGATHRTPDRDTRQKWHLKRTTSVQQIASI